MQGREGLLFAGIQVAGLDAQAAVGGNVEGKLDARDGARRWRDTVESEAAHASVADQGVVIPLEDVDADRSLVIRAGREGFAEAGRDGSPSGDEHRGHVVDGFDAQVLGQHRRRDLGPASAIWALDYTPGGFESRPAAGTRCFHGSHLLSASLRV